MQAGPNYSRQQQQPQRPAQAMRTRRSRPAQPQQRRHHNHPNHRPKVVDTSDKRFRCPDCDLKTGAQQRLDKHRQKEGPLVARFSCPGCRSTWTSAHAYCRHYQQCKRCAGKAYPRRAEYKKKKEDGEEEVEEVPKKPHLAPLCERCKSGLECSAARQQQEEDLLLASAFRALRM